MSWKERVDCPILDFGAFTPLTPPLQAQALKPSTRSDCSCFPHKGCGGQQQDVGEVGPSQCPSQGRCETEREANNNGSSPAPAPPSMSICDATTKTFLPVLIILLCIACCINVVLFRSCQLSILHHSGCLCCNSCCSWVCRMVLSFVRSRGICHDTSGRRVSSGTKKSVANPC